MKKNVKSIKGILQDFQTSRDIEYIFIANELNQIAYHSFDGEVPEDLIRKAKEQNISAQISITKICGKEMSIFTLKNQFQVACLAVCI